MKWSFGRALTIMAILGWVLGVVFMVDAELFEGKLICWILTRI